MECESRPFTNILNVIDKTTYHGDIATGLFAQFKETTFTSGTYMPSELDYAHHKACNSCRLVKYYTSLTHISEKFSEPIKAA